MYPLRFRVRTLMIAVAGLAILGASIRSVVEYWLLATEYRSWAQVHAGRLTDYADSKRNWEVAAEYVRRDPDRYVRMEREERRMWGDPGHAIRPPAEAIAELLEKSRANDVLIAYHRALWLKYDRAARHPWLVMTPDPPRPQ